jgi:hypothetical protein
MEFEAKRTRKSPWTLPPRKVNRELESASVFDNLTSIYVKLLMPRW